MMTKLNRNIALRTTALIGAIGVALGAFGAHGLEDYLVQHDRLDIWKTATLYLLVHAVVLLVLARSGDWRPGPWLAFLLGVFLFSGSLYLLCLTQVGALGAITPIGGILLLVGWLWLAFKP